DEKDLDKIEVEFKVDEEKEGGDKDRKTKWRIESDFFQERYPWRYKCVPGAVGLTTSAQACPSASDCRRGVASRHSGPLDDQSTASSAHRHLEGSFFCFR
ncbi:MAG: hypothetical protein ACPIOQ_68425, partial [Promethearchaeia archaeon]